ncbi:hypothetical protein, conserved in T. vivax [Trypanosoma vivax Y486]|uniref:Uncharacterized protein n=1 Tax=Trypanosoma vivax (strain Y486) TaxID=1055687 RepID=F9WTN7_TRYVY|nr:hypothetical protein, conserved in T. vivax [Trypanosoma vivax Y486]|eukprot:CCD20931.1 hypothetical protein, conserved in T. vivax [Trypanosoma vivax Y486]
MARASFPATKPSPAVFSFCSRLVCGLVTGINASQIVFTMCQFVARRAASAPDPPVFISFHSCVLCGADVSSMPSFAKFPAGVHGSLSAPLKNHRVPAAPSPLLLHSHIMSEARHWPAFRCPHPVFVEVPPPIVFLNSSPVSFSLASASAPASAASAASFFTSAAPLVASADQRHASHSGRKPLAHSCAAFVVFTSSHVPFDACSFSACQSASLQRSTLPAAPVAASTASSAARLARHSTRKSAAVCPFVAPSPSPTRVQSAAQSSHAATRSWRSMFPMHLPPLPCAAPLFAPRCTPLAANPCVHAPTPCLFSTT